MSKYITHFQTESEYQTALPSIELPNVSLVDELGEVHYHRALYGANAGDICLYDVAEGQKFFVTANNWNLTTYPTASYPIIGVVTENESPLGCVVMSCLYVNSDGSQTPTVKKYKWQNTAIAWPHGVIITTLSDAQSYNGTGKTETYAIIEDIKAYDQTYSTDNITGNIGGVIPLFAPTGTNAGDWFVPSTSILYDVQLNMTDIETTLTKINAADSSLSFANLKGDGSTYISSFAMKSELRAGGDMWYLSCVMNKWELANNMGNTTTSRMLIPFTIS